MVIVLHKAGGNRLAVADIAGSKRLCVGLRILPGNRCAGREAILAEGCDGEVARDLASVPGTDLYVCEPGVQVNTFAASWLCARTQEFVEPPSVL